MMKVTMMHICSMGMLLLTSQCWADFASDQAYAKSLSQTPNQAIQQYPAQSNLPGYSDHPQQESYYGGVEQPSTPLDQDAAAAVNQSESEASDQGAGNTVTNSFTTRSRSTIDINSPMIQTGQVMEQDSYNITHGISDDQVDCQTSGMCGGDLFCLNGDCAPNTPSQTSQQDFAQSATDLAAANGTSQDVVNQHPPNSQSIRIFSGQAMHCRKMATGFSNCCADHGWGQDMHLTKCNSEEKQLGRAREKGLAIRVGGTYCSHYVHTLFGKTCTVKSEGFCVFPGDIPLDTQRDGRGQLHMGWGSAHYPDCRGFTADEIAQIDFDRVDYSNYEQSVMQGMNVPSTDALQQQIQQQIQDEMNQSKG